MIGVKEEIARFSSLFNEGTWYIPYMSLVTRLGRYKKSIIFLRVINRGGLSEDYASTVTNDTSSSLYRSQRAVVSRRSEEERRAT